MGLTVDALGTPAVLVDLDVLERNVARMADAARRHGVRLRPHAKTHKSPDIGRLQLAAGAQGLSLAKTSEAQVFAGSGFDDIFIAFPVVGSDKARQLLDLAERARLAVGVDSVEGAATLARVFRDAGRRLDVMLKVDVGFHRVGVPPERANEVAAQVAEPLGAGPARHLHPCRPRLPGGNERGDRRDRTRGRPASRGGSGRAARSRLADP